MGTGRLILKGSRPPDAREAPQPRRSRGARVQACGRDSCQNHARPMISLAQTAILLAAAVVAVSLFRFARLSSILGYLVAGLVIGPWGLNLIGDVGGILQVSEFGIVLLLFIIGLELQPTRLWVMRRIVFGYGPAQVALCSLLLGAGAWALGVPPIASAVIGFGLSLSSTPLVLQVLAERGQLKTQYGRGAFGILLFQDLAVLPALALLPMLAPSSATHAASGSWWITLLKLLAVIVAVIGGGRLLLRPALRVVARAQVSEVFTAAALLTVIATALLANLAGLSMALGAFLAGVLLADSEFRHELEPDLLIPAVTLSMILGPLLLIAHEAIQNRWLAPPPQPYDAIEEHDNLVIIAGFGRVGQIVARILRVKGIPFTALDNSQTHVDFVRRFGNKVYYGDASRLELLRAAGADRARILVLAIDDADASTRTAALAREYFPRLKIYARARNRQHAFALMDVGVTEIVRDTYASSLEIAAWVLEALGEAPATAREAVRKFRQHDEATLLAQYQVKEDETKFLATTRESAAQLEKLFESDRSRSG